MSVQDTYLDTIPAGYAGALVNEEPRTLISRTVEGDDGVGFGVAVSQGAEDNGCVVASAAAVAPTFLGITVRDQSVNPVTPNKFAEAEDAVIMTKGVIWVIAGNDVDAGDGVAVLADGALGAGSTLVGARWDSTAATGELAKLRLA